MPKVYFIDLFCGAGGVTSGIHKARYMEKKFAKVIACVNHDPLAISSHKVNHPGCLHYIEKIQTLDLSELRALVAKLRVEDSDCLIFIWASLECTNFSKAKGGLPRDPDSRTLAEHMFRYLDELQPDGLWIENVEEFMSWGPLDENGKPISKRNGEDYIRWVNKVQEYGYNFDYRILNAADFGAYTSRRRYFAQFMRPGVPIFWPEATHAKNPTTAGLFGRQEKWKAVKDVLDFQDEGQSIFSRKKPLSEKTLERIYAGLIKYVAGGKDAFIAKYYSGNPQSMVIPVDGPAATIRTSDAQALVRAAFITKYFSGKPEGKVIPVDGPAGTVTTFGGQALVLPVSVLKYNSMSRHGVHIPPSLEEPAPTVACQPRLGLVQAAFLAKYYSNGGQLNSIEEPASTLSTKDRISKIQFSYLVNPSWGGCPTSTDQPSPVIIARGDKAPMYVVMAEPGMPQHKLIIGRSVADVKIRYFMSIYGIVDIKMRMLKIPELLRIQGFGDGYVLRGTQADQKRFIGNAVEVNQARVLIEAMYNGIVNYRELKTA